jgi:hypothetical protein
VTSLETATGAFKLATMKRDSRPGSSEPGSGSDSPHTEPATVWKKPDAPKPAAATAKKPEPEISEEDLMKQGISLTHRLSTQEISQRQFNWDEDDDDEGWRKEVETLAGSVKPKTATAPKEPAPSGSASTSASASITSRVAPWTQPQPAKSFVPISEQIKELSEKKSREQNLRHGKIGGPHYNYRLSDNAEFVMDSRYGGPADSRYRYNDYEKRYRSDAPPRQELYNAHNGQFEPVRGARFDSGRRRSSLDRDDEWRRRPSLDRPAEEENWRRPSTDRRVSFDRGGLDRSRERLERSQERPRSRDEPMDESRDQMSPRELSGSPAGRRLSTTSVGGRRMSTTSSTSSHQRTLLEEQEEVMRQTREKARKRKEEELQKEKERELAAKKKADELAKKMEEREKAKKEAEQGEKAEKEKVVDKTQKEKPEKGAKPDAAKEDQIEPAIKAVKSIIEEDEKPPPKTGVKLWTEPKTPTNSGNGTKLWANNRRNDLWGAASGSRFTGGALFDPGFLDKEKEGPSKSRILQREGLKQWETERSWRAPASPSSPVGKKPDKAPVEAAPQSPAATSPFATHDTTPNGSSRGMSRFFPSAQIEDGSPKLQKGEKGLFNGHGERGAHSGMYSPPRVVLPGTVRHDTYRAPSLNSIQAVQSTIAERLGMSPGAVPASTAVVLPMPLWPVTGRIPAEEEIDIPPLVRENWNDYKGESIPTQPAVESLKTQSHQLENLLLDSENQDPRVKLSSPLGCRAEINLPFVDMFASLVIPRTEFSTTSYIRDSSGYVHRREFEHDESATSMHTLIQLPGLDKMTIPRYQGRPRFSRPPPSHPRRLNMAQ